MVHKLPTFGVCVVSIAIFLPALGAQTSHALASDRIDPTQGTVSADLLRYHLPSKALQKLQEAHRAAEAGDHAAAIDRLQKILASYPESAVWSQSMLGVEYLKTGQYAAAVSALEEAVRLLPRNAINRSNLGLSLVLTGQYDRAEEELRRAIELDDRDGKTRQLLESLASFRTRNPLARSPD